jgi:hypothetical protein
MGEIMRAFPQFHKELSQFAVHMHLTEECMQRCARRVGNGMYIRGIGAWGPGDPWTSQCKVSLGTTLPPDSMSRGRSNLNQLVYQLLTDKIRDVGGQPLGDG